MDNEKPKDMISLPREEYDALIAAKVQLELILTVSDKDNYSADNIIDAVKSSRRKDGAEAVATTPDADSGEV